MKLKIIILALFLSAFVFVATRSYAQEDTQYEQSQIEEDPTTEELDLKRNKQRQSDANELQKEYKDKAKEAQSDANKANRINQDAADAAKQAKRSAKMEKRAQSARIKAEKQREKANRATQKSDSN